MNILKQLEQRLAGKPADPDNVALRSLVQSLCQKEKLDLSVLYELPSDDFELAIAVMKRWRLDRHTKTRDRLRELVCLPAGQELHPGAS